MATTEQIDGVPCFTVRSPGAFVQEVALPPAAAGMYAVIVGGQTGRVNAGPSITGLPYLYGLVIGTDRAGNLRRDRGASAPLPSVDALVGRELRSGFCGCRLRPAALVGCEKSRGDTVPGSSPLFSTHTSA